MVKMDVCQMQGRQFLGSVAIGLDTLIPFGNEYRPNKLLRAITYPYRAVSAAKEFQATKMRITVDGKVHCCSPLMVTISNGAYAGAGFTAVPGASVTDGMLHVCIVEAEPSQFVRTVIPDILSSAHVGQPGVRVLNGKSVVIAADTPFRARIDGECETMRRLTVLGSLPVFRAISRQDIPCLE
jgi:diacylglycerol kinase (ATP)